MKLFYLSKGHFSREYYLDSGSFGKHRETICNDPDYLIPVLKSKVDGKRKSNLFVIKDEFSEKELESIKSLFCKTKVKVGLENRINLD